MGHAHPAGSPRRKLRRHRDACALHIRRVPSLASHAPPRPGRQPTGLGPVERNMPGGRPERTIGGMAGTQNTAPEERRTAGLGQRPRPDAVRRPPRQQHMGSPVPGRPHARRLVPEHLPRRAAATSGPQTAPLGALAPARRGMPHRATRPAATQRATPRHQGAARRSAPPLSAAPAPARHGQPRAGQPPHAPTAPPAPPTTHDTPHRPRPHQPGPGRPPKPAANTPKKRPAQFS